jgi:hypothetical protein
MIKISIKEYAKKHVKCNPKTNLKEVELGLKDAVKRKKSGAKCNVCGAPIWAIGSAVGGFDGCFTCITGEYDDSEDYEVYQ